MARRVLGKLTARAVTSAGLGRHSDGGGLYLVVAPDGRRRWVLRYTIGGKARDMGLGAAREVTLAEAREAADTARRQVRDGLDPIEEREKARRELEGRRTFGETADEFLSAFAGGWRNPKHRAQWEMTLREYASPLRPIAIAAVSTADVLAVLKPHWAERPETASRLRGRIERVLDFAKVRGWRSGENPALWRGHLDKLLSKRERLTRGHHAAMPFEKVPGFVKELRGRKSNAALALEFAILTASRSGEVLGASGSEFDLDKGVWTVPAKRMKAGKEHRVPLSPRARAIAKSLIDLQGAGLLFTGNRKGKPLSSMAMSMQLRRMKQTGVTVHGFRSAFRDWAAECTPFPNEVCEAALAHVIGNKAEAAYRRGDLFEKRRKLMEAWEAYCEQTGLDNVVPITRTA
ncbi:MAG: integrase arm-type DNA-binding domain-containing protein [Phreatobacter sp.]|nr:integrase arm-type DNA-binding domain-containing protein [Phreatobacter sp.]